MRLTERLKVIHDTLALRDVEIRPRTRVLFYFTRLGIRIVKQWIRDKPSQAAAALTYRTVLSLVPMLAIAFTLLHAVGDKQTENNLLAFIATQVLPNMPDLVEHLRTFATNISTNAFGIIGLLFTLYTTWSVYDEVERVFNDIWRTGVTRRLLNRVLTFYALVTLLPSLAGVSLYLAGRFAGEAGAQFLGPLGIQFTALFLTNKLLPNTNVRWTAALIATLVTGLALELLKMGFVAFAKRTLLENYQGVYGAVGMIPLLLIWIWLSWWLVLLGAEIAHATQNMKRLEAEDRRRTGDEPVNGLSAAQVLALIAADHKRGGTGLTREALSEAFGLTPQAIDQICDRLKARKLVAQVHGDKEGYIPGRNASDILLDDVLVSFRATDLEMAAGRTSPALRNLIADLERTRRDRIAGVTIADLQPDFPEAQSPARVPVVPEAAPGGDLEPS